MIKKLFALLLFFTLFSSHDLFLKLRSYHVKPESDAEVFLYNGTFSESENVITRDRIQDFQMYGPNYYSRPDTSNWYDKGNVSYFKFKTGNSGTYLAGISTRPRRIELPASEFNEYLEHDGVRDILEARKKGNQLDKPAVEQYAKHVKAVFQAGKMKTGHFQKIMGYPIEFVPLENPYTQKLNDYLEFQLLKHSKPLPGHWVYAGYDDGHSHAREMESGAHNHNERAFKTDSEGKFKVKISQYGKWYVRTIHMVPSANKAQDYISNWGTLTFEVR
ncbi:MAG: DUF4198 domain-containing protein [Haliscomenobacter sp.]|nr:DUF4198 domain-containing protein [Haliscomenobacter sp.]